MVSSVSSSAAFSSAMVSSGSQCRGARDPQAFQEKLFSKLDANGDGGIDQSELSELVDLASSAVGGTRSTSSGTSATDLFKSMDTDGDGTLSKSELAEGTKKLFEELRTQLMSAAAASGTTPAGTSVDATTSNGTTDATASDAQATDASASATQAPPRAPRGGHHHGGGMFAKIASLLDQYRSNASDAGTTAIEASTLSVAA